MTKNYFKSHFCVGTWKSHFMLQNATSPSCETYFSSYLSLRLIPGMRLSWEVIFCLDSISDPDESFTFIGGFLLTVRKLNRVCGRMTGLGFFSILFIKTCWYAIKNLKPLFNTAKVIESNYRFWSLLEALQV